MTNRLVVIGAPSSAGAYSPGQEKTPGALRAAGLNGFLTARGIMVDDQGDVAGFRWRVDQSNPRAMNAAIVAEVARGVADRVAGALAEDAAVLVLGGDCTVEIGTLSGALSMTGNTGLVYIDLDTDLNTPESTDDGALDWMGVAHMLGIEGSLPELAGIGPRSPMLNAKQVIFFASGNSKPFERRIIEDLGIAEVRLAEVASDPAGAAQAVVDVWAKQYEQLIIHLDVDVLDYLDFPLAENNRRNIGLRFDQLVAALRVFLQAPNWTALTVTEVNPDHGEIDGSTLRIFAESLAEAIARSPRFR